MTTGAYTLDSEVPDDAAAFFAEHGFVRFANFATADEVAGLNAAIDELQQRWLAEGRTEVWGVPLKIGTGPDGAPMINRFAFTSVFSAAVAEFVNDGRLEPIRRFVGADSRLGERENDGVVVNQFVRNPGSAYSRLGWHTDSLRDIAYLRRPQPLYQVGFALTDSRAATHGGLRVMPGTNRQRIDQYLFRKLYFVDNRPDPREVAIEVAAGDLTIHDGRLWHRVAPSPLEGPASFRRVMYLPFIRGPVAEKHAGSPTPFYHRLARLVQ